MRFPLLYTALGVHPARLGEVHKGETDKGDALKGNIRFEEIYFGIPFTVGKGGRREAHEGRRTREGGLGKADEGRRTREGA